MADDDGETISFGMWVKPDREDVLREFDTRFASQKGDSRSERILDAMELYIDIDKVLNESGSDIAFKSERERRMWVRQALLDAIRAEMSE